MLNQDEDFEKGCKWFFPTCNEGAHERGFNNAMSEHFKSQSLYTTLVRESIQNSLDAVLDKTKPVIVKFSFYPIRNPFQTMPNLMGIKKHIQGSIDYWSKNREIKEQYLPMISYINNCKEALSFLRVSDYNTKGMDFQEDDNNCTFFAFLRAEGTSVKDMADSGGSFGFGKMAYFGLSNIQTILVSTMNKDNKVAFEGSAMLCTNKVDGIKYMDVGYYDANNGKPITDINAIPEKFKRTSPGTDINIIGIDFSFDSINVFKHEILKAVLTHFWMAVHKGKLEVHMGNLNITKNTLNELMIKNFPNKLDLNTRYENPRPYYEAVIGAEQNKTDCKMYEDVIPPLGKVNFYISRNRGSRDRYVAMRSPLMIVQQFNSQSNRGYSGVFICESEEGNELLKSTEPPAHDKWDKSRVQSKYSLKHKLARKALSEVRNFAVRCVNDFFKAAEQDFTTIKGLEEILYNVSKDDSNINIGNSITSNNGTQSSGNTNIENGSPIGSIKTSPKSFSEHPNIGHITVKEQYPTMEGGNLLGEKSDKRLRTHKENPNPKHGTSHVTNKQKIDNEGKENNVEHPIEVSYRCFAQQENEQIVHKLVFYSDTDINNVVLRLKSATADPGNLETIPIVWSNLGNVSENRIDNLQVSKGKNIIKFRFNDNIPHAVNLEAYYEEK